VAWAKRSATKFQIHSAPSATTNTSLARANLNSMAWALQLCSQLECVGVRRHGDNFFTDEHATAIPASLPFSLAKTLLSSSSLAGNEAPPEASKTPISAAGKALMKLLPGSFTLRVPLRGIYLRASQPSGSFFLGPFLPPKTFPGWRVEAKAVTMASGKWGRWRGLCSGRSAEPSRHLVQPGEAERSFLPKGSENPSRSARFGGGFRGESRGRDSGLGIGATGAALAPRWGCGAYRSLGLIGEALAELF